MESHQNNIPQFTIVLPVYNVAPYINECLNSIVHQTNRDFELLIIDDISTDESMAIVEHFLQTVAPKVSIKIIKHDNNKGLSAARNTGIEAAKGTYIVFVDSDDWIAQDMLENFAKYIEQHPDSIICGNTIQVTDGEHSPYWSSDEYLELDNTEAIQRMLVYDKVIDTAWAKITPRHLFIDYHIRFPENLYFEDTPTNVRLFNKANKIIVIKENVYYYRRNRVGSILQEKSFKSANDRLNVFENIYNYLLSDTSIDKDFALHYYLIRIAHEYRMVLNGYKLNVNQQQTLMKKISNTYVDLQKKFGRSAMRKNIGYKFSFLLRQTIYKSAFLFLIFHNTAYSLLRFIVDDL